MEAAGIPSDGGVEGQEAQAAPEATEPSVDLNPVLERLDELARGQQEYQPLLQRMQEQYGQQEEPEPDFSQLYTEDPYGSQQIDPDRLNGYLEQAIEKGVEQRLQPIMEGQRQIQQHLLSQEYDALAEDYPKLQDPKEVESLRGEIGGFLQSRGLPEHLANDPAVIETFHLAREARSRAAQEAPASSDGQVHLESSSGVNPGEPSKGDEDIARQILEAGGPRSVFG